MASQVRGSHGSPAIARRGFERRKRDPDSQSGHRRRWRGQSVGSSLSGGRNLRSPSNSVQESMESAFLFATANCRRPFFSGKNSMCTGENSNTSDCESFGTRRCSDADEHFRRTLFLLSACSVSGCRAKVRDNVL